MDITDTQQAVLTLIAERIAEEGMPPSQAEIARAFGFSSVRAAQYANQLARKLAKPATIFLVAVDAAPFPGVVTRIVPTADVSTRTYPVYVRLANRIDPDGPLLMGGMLARIELPTGTLAEARLVPKDALVLNRGRRQVFVVDRAAGSAQHGRVRAVDVTLGVAVGQLMQVEGSLQAGEVVVVRGNERLSEGQPVSIQENVSVE